MRISTSDEISFTHHAMARIQQRGVRLEALTLVLTEADQQHHVGRGAVAERISRHKRDWLRRNGAPVAVVEAAGDLVVVFAEDGAIMTVICRPTQRGRVYLGAERNNPRRHAANRYR